jgi:hypothetical protein
MKLFDFLQQGPINVVDEEDVLEVYPGQSSGRLKNYISRRYGGEIGCRKVGTLLKDPDVPNFYKKRAKWYKSLHCKGAKQVREDEEGAALTIFDIDDTLFRTTARVKMKTPDGKIKILTPAEWDKLQKDRPHNDHSDLDFDEFTDAKLFYDTSTPIKTIWKAAQKVLVRLGKRPGSRVVIISARHKFDDFNLFIETFRRHGLDIPEENFFTVGGAHRKKKKIIELLDEGAYTEARMFDDHLPNLIDFLNLKTESRFSDITFKAIPVGRSGKLGKPIIV